MTLNEAARTLRERINAPSWALSVVPWTENQKQKLIVRVDQKYHQHIDIPEFFEGFSVEVQWKNIFRAL